MIHKKVMVNKINIVRPILNLNCKITLSIIVLVYIPRANGNDKEWEEIVERGRTTKLFNLTSEVPPDSNGMA